MSEQKHDSLRRHVNLLGTLLGETISEAQGPDFLQKIEDIRQLSKSTRFDVTQDKEQLKSVLLALDDDELLPVARAFSQFLNLANIADQHHTISRDMDSENSATQSLASVFSQLQSEGIENSNIVEAIADLSIDLVLTAHPTEITRRTLIHKHGEIEACLSQLELEGLTEREIKVIQNRLRELIAQIWHTQDFRRSKPTPIDEAKWGFAVVENSLWQAVPEFIRRLDTTLFEAAGERLPIDAAPVTFSSWLGGDRDGNPNVTATVSREVLALSQWQAIYLYQQDVEELIEELSMTACNAAVSAMTDNTREPYRAVLRSLRSKLRSALALLSQQTRGEVTQAQSHGLDEDDIWQPLHACYQSLVDCGMQRIANGKLLDLLRRVKCFGVHLVRLDIRQDAGRHESVLAELLQYLDLGDYLKWSEAEKQSFLLQELASKRPLIPEAWAPSEESREVLDTCRVIAGQPENALGFYVISMARQASDVLAVELLLKATGRKERLPVVPLFETLDDLNRSEAVVETLLALPSYKAHINDRLMIMIGYSDSAKDAGMLAASWAQYQAQEKLLQTCARHEVRLTLFHGRGGTIGRGGAPAHAALLSQPPGSLSNGLRVTEQGEMIRTKLGLTGLAVQTLALYTSAILQANLSEPPSPKASWRKAMNQLSDNSCDHYRSYVQQNPDFVSYFREATPEQELAKLPLGSRPARRNTGGGIASLRAIPWIFAWMQNRLMLPAWLGAGKAFADLIDQGKIAVLQEMAASWPFFSARLSMLEMVFAKSDADLSAYYDEKLVSSQFLPIGNQLREQLLCDKDVVLQLLKKNQLLEDQHWARESILLRNIYTDPLNVLQVELLQRNRAVEEDSVQQALMVTIAGIAAGMRNTG